MSRLRSHYSGIVMAMFALLFSASAARAGDLVVIDSRGLKVSGYWHATVNATKTLFVFPGGAGGFGKVKAGLPTSGNFVVRTTPLWIAQGYNVFIFGLPDDSDDLDFGDRTSNAHLQDVRAAMNWVLTQSARPVWIVGTSRGTISGAHVAIKLKDPHIEGLVLTASVVSYKKAGALPKQDVGSLAMPVLLYHSEADACVLCLPQDVKHAFSQFKGNNKQLIMAKAGVGASGDPCRGQHHHGFIGSEDIAVRDISAFINRGGP